MASENEIDLKLCPFCGEKRETSADIADEIRRAVESMGDEMPYTVSAGTMRMVADRITAAWRREKAEIEADALAVGGIVEAARHNECGTPTTEKSSAVGNAAAMHTALKGLDEEMTFCERNVELGIGLAIEGLREHCRIVRQILNAALSAPARQCDVGTPEKQAERFGKLCGKYYNEEEPCNEKCPLASLSIIHGFPRCQAYWAQMPYAAEEGGAE